MPTIDGGGRDQRIKEALEKKVICRRCQVEMVPKSTFFLPFHKATEIEPQ